MQERQVIRLSETLLSLPVGVSAQERARPQGLRVSLVLELSAGGAFFDRDALEETVDYARLVSFLRDGGLAAFGPFALIETIADRICAFALGLSPLVEAVETSVAKPSVLPPGEGLVSVSIRRTAGGALAIAAPRLAAARA